MTIAADGVLGAEPSGPETLGGVVAVAALDPRVSKLRRARRLVVVAAVGLALSAGSTSVASPAGTVSRAAMGADTYEARVELYVNEERAAHGMPAVHFESCTDLTAERWAERVATTGELLHQSSATIMKACRVSYAGETLGRGDFGPRTLVRAWMRSPLHREVLLNRQAKRIGVGSHRDGSGRWVTSVSLTRR